MKKARSVLFSLGIAWGHSCYAETQASGYEMVPASENEPAVLVLDAQLSDSDYETVIYWFQGEPNDATLTVSFNGTELDVVNSLPLEVGEIGYFTFDISAQKLLAGELSYTFSSSSDASLFLITDIAFNVPQKRPIDVNSNGVDDFYLLGVTPNNNRDAVLFFDTKTSALTGSLVYPNWFTPFELATVSSVDGNDSNEIVAMGETSDGKRAWMLFDSVTRSYIRAKVFPSWLRLENMVVIDDISGNGYDEIVVLGENAAGNRYFFIHDSHSGEEILRQNYPSWFTPHTMISVAGDSIKLASFGQTSDDRTSLFVSDSATGAASVRRKENSGESIHSVDVFDVDNDATYDLVSLINDSNSNRSRVDIRESDTGYLKKTIGFPSWFIAQQTIAIEDVNGDGAEIVTLGKNTAGRSAVFFNNGVSGSSYGLVGLPAWFSAFSIQVIEDINESGFEEIAIWGQKLDGSYVWMIYDSATLQRINAVAIPSWFLPKPMHNPDENGYNVERYQLKAQSWSYYPLDVSANDTQIDITLSPESTSNKELFLVLNKGGLPTLSEYDAVATSTGTGVASATINASAGKWYVGVYAKDTVSNMALEAIVN